jgi:hypothetical protein
MSVAWTIRTASSFNTAGTMVSQWGAFPGDQAFVAQVGNSDELGFVVQSGGADYYGPITTDSPLPQSSNLLRIVVRIDLSPKTSDIWMNGSQRTTTAWFNNSPAFYVNSAEPAAIGLIPTVSAGVDGEYSEFAVWDHWVPDWVVIAYGKGRTPQAYQEGGVFYAPTVNVQADGLRDVWGGLAGTNSSGTSAAHPAMYRSEGDQ